MFHTDDTIIMKTKLYAMDHDIFFQNDSFTRLEVDGLDEYMFYVFTVAYQTNHSVGNFTNPYVVRTKEGGEDVLIWSSDLKDSIEFCARLL